MTARKIRATRKCVKQNVTISLDQATVRKAKVLAARRGSSISRLLAEQIEALVSDDELYEQSKRQAVSLLETGFHLGGSHRIARVDLHER